MAKTFEINGKKYTSQVFDYNTICDLQDIGIDVENMAGKGASMMRAFFAVWSGMSLKEAGNELGKHIMAGGTVDELAEAINAEMEASGFFPTQQTTEEETSPESKAKKPEKED